MARTKTLNNKEVLIKLYKLYVIDDYIEDPKDNEILRRYKKILNFAVGNPEELILDIKYTKNNITFITGDFRKFIVPFSFIKGWKALAKKDKYDIYLDYAALIFGDDKLFFPFDEILYEKDPKYKKRRDKENAPYRKELGKKIRAMRLKYNKKQRDIKNLSEREVSRIENGHVWPSFKTQRKLAEGFGIGFKRFLNELHG